LLWLPARKLYLVFFPVKNWHLLKILVKTTIFRVCAGWLFKVGNDYFLIILLEYLHFVYVWTVTLTLWEPVYEYIVPGFRPKTGCFRLPYQCHSSSADCARELFKGSNGSASLLVWTRKNVFGWGVRFFCDWRHKWSSSWVILAHVTWPMAQPLGQSISLKFLLETRLESESFKPSINFLAFLVQKLWSKMNKLINYLISQILLLL